MSHETLQVILAALNVTSLVVSLVAVVISLRAVKTCREAARMSAAQSGMLQESPGTVIRMRTR